MSFGDRDVEQGSWSTTQTPVVLRSAESSLRYTLLGFVAFGAVGAGLVVSSLAPTQKFLVVAMPLVLMVLVMRPRAFLLLYYGFCILGAQLLPAIATIQYTLPLGVVVNPAGVLQALIFLGFLLYTLIHRKSWLSEPLGRLLLSYLGLMAIALAYGGFIEFGIRRWVHYANWICASLLLFDSTRTREQVIRVLQWMGLILSVNAFAAIWGAATGQGMGVGVSDTAHFQVRATGLGTQAVGAGEVTFLAAIASLALIMASPDWLPRSLTRILVAVFALAGFLTLSRAPLLGFAVAALFVLWRAGWFALGRGLLVLIILATLLLLNPRFDLLNVMRGDIDPVVYANLVDRLNMHRFLVQNLTLRSILTGRGLGAVFVALYGRFGSWDAHGEIPWALYEMGIVGVFFSLFIPFTVFRTADGIYRASSDRLAQGLALAAMGFVAAVCVFMLTTRAFPSAGTSYTFWMPVAMLWAVRRWMTVS